AGRLKPRSVEVQLYLDRVDRLARERAEEARRRKEFERQQALALEYKLRQDELAHEAERQRILAAQPAAALAEQERVALEKKRLADQLAAHNQLVVQARVALKQGNVKLSVQIFESAVSLLPSDDVYRELALARAELDRVTKQRQAEEAKLLQ